MALGVLSEIIIKFKELTKVGSFILPLILDSVI